MFGVSKKVLDQLKAEYPSGARVRLVSMEDPYVSIPIGTKGTVSNVDDIGTIHVHWDTGHHLGIAYGEDECEIIHTVKTSCYGKEKVWDSREDAIKYFLKELMEADGSERDKYWVVLEKLKIGLDVCTAED